MLALVAATSLSFTVQPGFPSSLHAAAYHAAPSPSMNAREPFSLTVDLPPRGKCALKFKPLFGSSEAVVVKYDIPFGLNVENKDGAAVCTKAGPGGEQPGDVLRYCTEWTIGLPGGPASLGATVSSFSGVGLGYQLGLCDVAKAESWDDVRRCPVSKRAPLHPTPARSLLSAPYLPALPKIQVVQALTSNTQERTDYVLLVFERPTEQ